MAHSKSSFGEKTHEMHAFSFAPLSARRRLVLGGIGLILIGMFFGDIFAVVVLHQNAARVGASLASAAHAALSGGRSMVRANLQDVGAFLENRGTKVDTHVHMIDFGYLALMLAILQPWIAFSEGTKKGLAWIFLAGTALLPVGSSSFITSFITSASRTVRCKPLARPVFLRTSGDCWC